MVYLVKVRFIFPINRCLHHKVCSFFSPQVGGQRVTERGEREGQGSQTEDRPRGSSADTWRDAEPERWRESVRTAR